VDHEAAHLGRCAAGDAYAVSMITDDLDLGERAAIALAETMHPICS
jgi:hypothetical protein